MKTENISLSANEKISLISNFSTMLTAGIPILEAIDSLLEGSKNNQKKILDMLRNDVAQGLHVYASFSKFPRVFNSVTVQILKAAEEAGTLEVTLKDLKDDIKKEAEFVDKVRGALIYPVFIIVVFLGVLLLMLTFVIPRISTVFGRLKVELPLPTKILIFVSNAILTYKLFALVGSILFFAFLFFLYKAKRDFLVGLLSSLPIISDLIKQIDLTKFSRSLFLLLNAGIPITTALELTQDTVTRNDIKKAIMHCHDVVVGGKKLSEGFRDEKNVIPNIMIKITEAGEHSGSLDRSMRDISEYLDYQVSNKLKTVTALIEPLMLVVVGILIGGMMLAIIAPIYGLISQVASR